VAPVRNRRLSGPGPLRRSVAIKLRRLYHQQAHSPRPDRPIPPALRDRTLARSVADSLSPPTRPPPTPAGTPGAGTINTRPEAAIAVFEGHGTIARSIDRDVNDANAVLNSLAHAGVDMESVGIALEGQGGAGVCETFAHALDTVDTKLVGLRRN
jgi:hypothetical protein